MFSALIFRRSLAVSFLALTGAVVTPVHSVVGTHQSPSVRLPDAITGIRGPGVVLPSGMREASKELLEAGVAVVVPSDESMTAFADAIIALRNSDQVSAVTVVGTTVEGEQAAFMARADSVIVPSSRDVPMFSSRVVTRVVGSRIVGLDDLRAVIRAPSIVQHPTGPRVSRRGFSSTVIGTGRIAVEYGRPRRRNRSIWGTLIKWGHFWTPGADEGTVLTTSQALTLGDLEIAAGEYAVYALPTEKNLTLVLSYAVGEYHNVFRLSDEVGRTSAEWTRTSLVEELAIDFPRGPEGISLRLAWDDRSIALPVRQRH